MTADFALVKPRKGKEMVTNEPQGPHETDETEATYDEFRLSLGHELKSVKPNPYRGANKHFVQEDYSD